MEASTRLQQYTAVILAGGCGGRLYPLTIDSDSALVNSLPKPLLPVATRPLLWYQLRLLEKAGFGHALIVTVHRFEERLTQFISAFACDRDTPSRPLHRFYPELLILEDHCGTADALRSAREKIKTDFVVISGDLITNSVLHQLADIHRIRDSTVTMLLKGVPSADDNVDDVEKNEVLVKKMRQRKENDVVEFIGLVEGESRVVLVKEGALDVEDSLLLPKIPLLRRRPAVTVHTDLLDAHLYFFGHWVLDLLQEKPHISSIKADLVPYLVRHQFRAHCAAPVSTVRHDIAVQTNGILSKRNLSSVGEMKTLSLAASLSAVRVSIDNVLAEAQTPATAMARVDLSFICVVFTFV